MATIRPVIHERRIEVPAPEFPNGTEVFVEISAVSVRIRLNASRRWDGPEPFAARRSAANN